MRVFAGEGEEQFTVHKNFFTRKSPYFIAASREASRQGDEQNTVRLWSVDGDIFALYLQWVYTDGINLDTVDSTYLKCQQHNEDPRHEAECARELRMAVLAKLYIAGDLLLDLELKESVMDKVVEGIQAEMEHPLVKRSPFTWPIIDYIRTNTAAWCQLHNCVLDVFYSFSSPGGLPDENVEQYHPQFLLDMCNRQCVLRTASSPIDFGDPGFSSEIYHDLKDESEEDGAQ